MCSLGITILVALPWQLYIIFKYPLESAFEYSLNSKHFFEAIENHSGTWTYHFDNSELLYGFPIILLLLSVFFLRKSIVNPSIRAGIISVVGMVYVFFSLASTKMPGFVFIIAPIVLISFAVLVTYLFRFFIINPVAKKASLITSLYHSVVILLLSFYTLDIEEIQSIHTSWGKDSNHYWHNIKKDQQLILSLNDKIPQIEDYVIFNLDNYKNISAMFFTDVQVVYQHIPTIEDVERVKKSGYKIAIYDNGNLPEYLYNDSEIHLFH